MAFPAFALNKAHEQAKFETWLQTTVWPRAHALDVPRDVFENALGTTPLHFAIPGVAYPGQTQNQDQAEFRSPARYFRQDNLTATARIGAGLAQKHAQTLQQLQKDTGVPGRILLAIWGRESGFGNVAIKHNAFQVLGTRAFYDGGEYLLGELLAALQIAHMGHAPTADIKSSWAGALGQPQMMPRSFMAYARDGTGDGRADIWGSQRDTLASIANFLQVHAWAPKRDWGFEVTLPPDIPCHLEGPDNARPIAEWVAMGIKRVGGRAFPAHELPQNGSLMLPAGRYGPAFIVTPNFYVIKRYNHSDAYALYVGHSGDKIEWGVQPFATPWRDVDKLRRGDVAQIQRALESLGHDVGGGDGLAGFKTRRSIGKWQAQNGQDATCYPSQALLQELGG